MRDNSRSICLSTLACLPAISDPSRDARCLPILPGNGSCLTVFRDGFAYFLNTRAGHRFDPGLSSRNQRFGTGEPPGHGERLFRGRLRARRVPWKTRTLTSLRRHHPARRVRPEIERQPRDPATPTTQPPPVPTSSSSARQPRVRTSAPRSGNANHAAPYGGDIA
jgi:hypothetical protein